MPHGLIGFPQHHHATLHYQADHLPFLWMKLKGPDAPVHFVVIEPGGIIPTYAPGLFADDAFALDLHAGAFVDWLVANFGADLDIERERQSESIETGAEV